MAGGIDWLRWHHGTVADGKFRLVAKRAGGKVSEVIAVWAFLMEAASQSANRGDHGDLDFEAIDCALELSDGLSERIHAALTDRRMIAAGRLTAWEKRQPKREREDNSAAERKRKQRAKSSTVTPSHAESHQKTPRGEESREEAIATTSPGSTSALRSGTEAGRACRLMGEAGCAGMNPSHPDLLAALAEGVTGESLADTVREGIANNIRKPFAWAITTARGRHADGARTVATGPPRTRNPSNGNTSLAVILGASHEQHPGSAVVLDVDPRGSGEPALPQPRRLSGG